MVVLNHILPMQCFECLNNCIWADFRETDGDMFCRANGTDNGNYERSGVFNLWDESNIHNTNDHLMSKTISSHLLVLPILYFITD